MPTVSTYKRAVAAPAKLLIVAAACCLSVSTAAIAEDIPTRIDVSLSAHYSSGDYGNSSTTRIFYAPLVTKAEIGPWLLKLTIPFLLIDGGGGIVDGVQTNPGTSEGLGDILLEGGYTFETLSSPWPCIELTGKIKFPTADRSEGLGTGEFDFTPELGLFYEWGSFTPFVEVGYRILGDRSSDPLRNGVVASAGLLWEGWDSIDLGGFAYWRQASTSSVDDPAELVPFARWKFSETWAVDAYVSAGLTDGSPDVGSGLQLRYRYDTWL